MYVNEDIFKQSNVIASLRLQRDRSSATTVPNDSTAMATSQNGQTFGDSSALGNFLHNFFDNERATNGVTSEDCQNLLSYQNDKDDSASSSDSLVSTNSSSISDGTIFSSTSSFDHFEQPNFSDPLTIHACPATSISNVQTTDQQLTSSQEIGECVSLNSLSAFKNIVNDQSQLSPENEMTGSIHDRHLNDNSRSLQNGDQKLLNLDEKFCNAVTLPRRFIVVDSLEQLTSTISSLNMIDQSVSPADHHIAQERSEDSQQIRSTPA